MSELPWVVECNGRGHWEPDGAFVAEDSATVFRDAAAAKWGETCKFRIRDTRLDVPPAPLDCAPDVDPTPHMDRVMADVAARTRRTLAKPLDADAVRAIVREAVTGALIQMQAQVLHSAGSGRRPVTVDDLTFAIDAGLKVVSP